MRSQIAVGAEKSDNPTADDALQADEQQQLEEVQQTSEDGMFVVAGDDVGTITTWFLGMTTLRAHGGKTHYAPSSFTH